MLTTDYLIQNNVSIEQTFGLGHFQNYTNKKNVMKRFHKFDLHVHCKYTLTITKLEALQFYQKHVNDIQYSSLWKQTDAVS